MSREIFICEICGEIYDRYKDLAKCCKTKHCEKRRVEELKIELADLVVAFQDSANNMIESLKYFQKRRNLINQIKEMESES